MIRLIIEAIGFSILFLQSGLSLFYLLIFQLLILYLIPVFVIDNILLIGLILISLVALSFYFEKYYPLDEKYLGFKLGAGSVIGTSESMLTRGIEDKCFSNFSTLVISSYHLIYSIYQLIDYSGSGYDYYQHVVAPFRHLYDLIFAFVMFVTSECH